MSAEPTAPQTFAQKALARASGKQFVAVGEVVDARPDIVLSHDATAAIREIWLGFGMDHVVAPERLAITLDHAVPAPTPRHALNHKKIREFVKEQGIKNFFEIGRGICHQVLSEEALVLPGQLILGGDSHTPHFGWLGAFGAGVGRSEIAVLWATGELWLRVPESMRIEISGDMRPWVSAKDLALHIIGTFGADGGLYRSIEIVGDTTTSLSHSSRATLANMMAEFGAKNSWIAPDASVFDSLALIRAQQADETTGGRTRAEWRQHIEGGALYPDEGATYTEQIAIDASSIGPQVACPHAVDRTVSAETLNSIGVDQAFLGTCTNGRLEDIEIVHHVLAGKRVATGTRFLIIPASSQVLQGAIARGWVSDLMAAGAVFGTPGCGPCMGNHLGVLAAGETCISSANRNFRGRMAEPDADIYLSSPAVVAASAIAGRITTPEQLGIEPLPSHQQAATSHEVVS